MANKGTLLTSGFQGNFNRYYRYLEPVIRDPLVRGYFEIIATIVLVGLLVLLALKPSIETVAHLIRQSDDLKEVKQKLDEKRKNLTTARSNYDNIKEHLPILDRAIPINPEIPQLLVDLERSVNKEQNIRVISLTTVKTGLTSDAWKRNDQFKPKDKVPLGFDLTVKTTYPLSVNLLSNLLSLPRLVHLKRVSFAADPTSTTSGILQVGYEGEAYFLPDEK